MRRVCVLRALAPVLALVLSACGSRFEGGGDLRAQKVVLNREVEGLREVVARLEKGQPILPVDDVAVAITHGHPVEPDGDPLAGHAADVHVEGAPPAGLGLQETLPYAPGVARVGVVVDRAFLAPRTPGAAQEPARGRVPAHQEAVGIGREEALVAAEQLVGALAAQQHLDVLADRLAVLAGRPAKAAAASLAEEPADLVILGMRGYSSLRKLILGRTAELVMRSIELPVLMVP